jgi:hypothetical protein
MKIWGLHQQTTEEQARKNRESSNGKNLSVEDTAPLDDDYDVNIRLAGSGVVYDPARPDNTTVRSRKCSHGGHDRCICGMDGA